MYVFFFRRIVLFLGIGVVGLRCKFIFLLVFRCVILDKLLVFFGFSFFGYKLKRVVVFIV